MIGTNEETARICGVPIVGAKFSAYVISSLLAGLAAIILTARLNAAASSMVGDTMTTDAISAAIIGGASLLGISYYIGMVVKGVMIVLVIAIDVFRSSESTR